MKPIYTDTKGRAILHALADAFDVPVSALTGPSRSRALVEARYLVVAVLLDLTTATLMDVARLLCRDHTTIIYARDQINARCATDPQLAAVREELGMRARATLPRTRIQIQEAA